MRQIVLDTETTGLSPHAGDRIIEIGCVELVNRRLTGNNLHLYLNPERESHEDALKVHGLTTEFLQDKPKFAQVAQQFLEFVRGAEIIIHNAPFDVGFLDAELERVGEPEFHQHVEQVVDSLAMAKQLYPGKRNSLDALCERLGVDNSSRTLHGALLDAELLADVYIALTRGQEMLLEEEHGPSGTQVPLADYRGLKLVVIEPSAQELQAHEQMLTEIDKASGGKTLWRTFENQGADEANGTPTVA